MVPGTFDLMVMERSVRGRLDKSIGFEPEYELCSSTSRMILSLGFQSKNWSFQGLSQSLFPGKSQSKFGFIMELPWNGEAAPSRRSIRYSNGMNLTGTLHK
jgi:hypothetical protein